MLLNRFGQVVQLLFTFKGRINRKAFWAVTSVWILTLTTIILIGIYNNDFWLAIRIFQIASILWFVPGLAISVKRFHDRNKNGWWCFIAWVPVIGPWWFLIETGFLRGTDGSNKYGEPPT